MKEDGLIVAADRPDMKAMEEDYQEALNRSRLNDRMTESEDVRMCRWGGQSSDGRKWDRNMPEGKRAMPWDGASDTRVMLVDDVITDAVDTLMVSWRRSMIGVTGIGAEDLSTAAQVRKYLAWLLGPTRLGREMEAEMELLCQYGLTYPYALMHISWQRRTTLKLQRMTMADVEALAAHSPEGAVARDLPALVQDPLAEDSLVEMLMGWKPFLKRSRAVRIVRELRKSGASEWPEPVVTGNGPCVVALAPYRDVLLPPGTTDLQEARAIHLRRWYSEVQLRQQAREEGWSDAFLEEAVKEAGTKSPPTAPLAQTMRDAYYAGDTRHKLEIVYSYVNRVDEDGVSGIYCTVWSPQVKVTHGEVLCGAHTLVDYAHGEYPFVMFRRERLARDVEEGRSVPEVLATLQNELKCQRDSLFDRTQFDTLPPVITPKLYGQPYRFGPAAQIQANRPDAVRFMDPIRSSPQLALECSRYVKQSADEYFGRPGEGVAPDRTAIKRERMVGALYGTMTAALRQILQLAAQYGDPAEYMRVTGSREPLTEEAARYDLELKWDSRELSNEFMYAKLQAMTQMVVPEDAAGVIDRAKLVWMKMRALDPSLADELVMDKGVAQQKIFTDVMQTVALMALGNEAQYVENDATAPTKLEMLRQIVLSNPKYQAALQQDERFKELLMAYEKNLQQSVKQQQNVMIGRTGVKPVQN